MKEFVDNSFGGLALLAFYVLSWPSLVYAQESVVLDDSCIVSILNRNTQVSPNGDFSLSNIPLPVGAFRARVVCEDTNGLRRAQSAFVLGVANGETDLGLIAPATSDVEIPIAITISSSLSQLTPNNDSIQLSKTGTLAA